MQGSFAPFSYVALPHCHSFFSVFWNGIECIKIVGYWIAIIWISQSVPQCNKSLLFFLTGKSDVGRLDALYCWTDDDIIRWPSLCTWFSILYTEAHEFSNNCFVWNVFIAVPDYDVLIVSCLCVVCCVELCIVVCWRMSCCTVWWCIVLCCVVLCWMFYSAECRSLLFQCLWSLYSEEPNTAVERKANEWIRVWI